MWYTPIDTTYQAINDIVRVTKPNGLLIVGNGRETYHLENLLYKLDNNHKKIIDFNDVKVYQT